MPATVVTTVGTTPEKGTVRYDRGGRVNVTVLIVMTTLVSTVCSVAGGVWMYLQSVESLESVVESSSETEVGRLKDEIVGTINEVKTANRELLDLFMSVTDPIIQSPVPIVRNATTNFIEVPESVTEEWTKLIRWKAWSRVANSKVVQEVGIVLVPWEREDPAGQYTHIWYDLKSGGVREYVFARYGQHLNPKAYDINADPWVQPLVLVDALHENNGTSSYEAYNYSFNTFDWPKKYGLPHDGDFTKYTPDTYPGDSFIRGEGRAVLTRFRSPTPWYATDNNTYVFAAFDTGYLAPPPPHPWSQYKQVWLQTYFVFSVWEEAITTYAKQHEDTTVIIYDQTTEIVYTATTGQTMINQECWLEDRHGKQKDIKECAVRIVNMSSVIQAGWRSAGFAREEPRPDSVFWKKNLDGSEHFLRQTQLFTFVPASGEPAMDIAILWLTTTRSVQNKVMAALVVFITFACLVFVFDATMALLEIFLVAIPLNRIAGTLDSLQTFEPDVVEENLNRITFSKCLSVKEVHAVSKGLVLACKALKEYKAFLPNTLFAEETTDEETASVSKSNVSHSRSCTEDVTTHSHSTAHLRALHIHPTGLSLQLVKGSFVKVRFESEGSGGVATWNVGNGRSIRIPDSFVALTELVEQAGQTTKGVVHGFAPHDPLSFYVTWNVSSKCADTPMRAALFANTILRSEVCKGMSVSVGMAHGTVQAGNLGSQTHRGFGMCGLVMEHLQGAQAYASHLQKEVKRPVAVLGAKFAELLTGSYLLEAVGVLQVNYEDKPSVMYCLKKASEAVEQEWMYQIESSSTDHLHPHFAEVARTQSLTSRVDPSLREVLSREQLVALDRLLGPPQDITESFFQNFLVKSTVAKHD